MPPFLLSCDESDDGMQDIHEDDPRARRQDSGSSGISRSRRRMKKRARTPSILLETNSSDICVDLWIRDECVESQNRRAKARSRRNNRAWDSSGCDEAEDEYWPSDWTMTQPWPHKTREVIIEAFSRKGNISLRIVSPNSLFLVDDANAYCSTLSHTIDFESGSLLATARFTSAFRATSSAISVCHPPFPMLP